LLSAKTVTLRRLGGTRAAEVRFGRFLRNPAVTVAAMLASWSERTAAAARGRHVLAFQDTTEIAFATTPADRRGLGRVGKGNAYGVLAHAMLACDAGSGHVLGLVDGWVWTRGATPVEPHHTRALADKESRRWLECAERAKAVLGEAASVTIVADRESDLYAEWAQVPEARVHLLTRACQDRRLAGGGTLFGAALAWPVLGRRTIEVPSGPTALRQRRPAVVSLKLGRVEVQRPKNSREPGLPASVTLSLLEVREADPPAGATPVVWRLLTTHTPGDAAAGWEIVDWYRRRWLIEQLFRTMKQKGFRIEDSDLESAEALLKLTTASVKAAARTLQLMQARDGTGLEPASLAFDATEVAALQALVPTLEGKTAKQKNPHPPLSLAWAAWAIARLGGWKGYASEGPPGPITFNEGLKHFQALVQGFSLRDVCIR
jgi:hypothetical protein